MAKRRLKPNLVWRLTTYFSGGLAADEREAVLGDLAESQTAGLRGLAEVFGLVIRREAAEWALWYPWIVLLAYLLPVGLLLSRFSLAMSDHSAIYLWLYANNWQWAFTTNPGFWELFWQNAISLFLGFLMLGCLAWSYGFLLGAWSGRTPHTNQVILLFALLSGGLLAKRGLLGGVYTFGRSYSTNAAAFASDFYRFVLPLLVQVILVALPALWAVNPGRRLPARPALIQSVVWAGVALTLIYLITTSFPLLAIAHRLGSHNGPVYIVMPRPPSWYSIALKVSVFWPLLYFAATARKRRSHTPALG